MVDVSVIVPIRNAQRFVAGAVTALNQLEFDDLEIILVDDASTDDTPDALIEASQRNPSITIILLEERAGSGNARNVGLARAKGKFVWFVDIDDLWNPKIVKHLYNLANSTGCEIAVCGAEVIDPNGKKITHLLPPFAGVTTGRSALQMLLLGKLEGHTWNKLIRRDLLREDVFPLLPTHQDLAAMFEILPKANGVALSRESLYSYVRHEASSLNSGSRKLGGQLGVADHLRTGPVALGPSVPAVHVAYFINRHVFISSIRDYARLSRTERRRKSSHLIAVRAARRTWSTSSIFTSKWFLTGLESAVATQMPHLYGFVYRRIRALVRVRHSTARRSRLAGPQKESGGGD